MPMVCNAVSFYYRGIPDVGIRLTPIGQDASLGLCKAYKLHRPFQDVVCGIWRQGDCPGYEKSTQIFWSHV